MAARLQKVKKALQFYGIFFEPSGGGSHLKIKGKNGICYTLPASKGLKTEISDAYIAGICRHFGINRSEFSKRI